MNNSWNLKPAFFIGKLILLVFNGLGAQSDTSIDLQPYTGQYQSDQSMSLYAEIIKMDSILFHAFNHRDLATIKMLFSDELEFYHDQGGLSDYEQNIASTTDLFSRDYVLERKLVPGSTEVYPIRDYGAVMTGEHEFCHEENDRMDCGTFKFVHIWKKQEDGGWKLTRVVSYGH